MISQSKAQYHAKEKMNIFTKWFIIIIKVFTIIPQCENIPNKERVAVSKRLSCSVCIFPYAVF